MRTRRLTTKQQVVLDTIKDFHRQHGYAPTVRDLGVALGINSNNGVVCHLQALRDKGRLTWDKQVARSLQVIDTAPVDPDVTVDGGEWSVWLQTQRHVLTRQQAEVLMRKLMGKLGVEEASQG